MACSRVRWKNEIILAQTYLWEVKSFPERAIEKSLRNLLSLKWRRTAQMPRRIRSVGDHCDRRLGRIDVPRRVLADRDLLFYAFQQDYEFFRLMISLCLLAHLLEILRSIIDTISHGEFASNINDRY